MTAEGHTCEGGRGLGGSGRMKQEDEKPRGQRTSFFLTPLTLEVLTLRLQPPSSVSTSQPNLRKPTTSPG